MMMAGSAAIIHNWEQYAPEPYCWEVRLHNGLEKVWETITGTPFSLEKGFSGILSLSITSFYSHLLEQIRYNHSTFSPQYRDLELKWFSMAADEQINKQADRQRDARCIQRIRSGDSEAFSELVKAYYPVFYHLVLGITSNPDNVEDLVQEGFISIFSNLEALKQPERFGSWGYTLVKRIATRYSWRLKKERTLSNSKDPVVVAMLQKCFAGHPHRGLSHSEENRYENLWDAIRKLSEKHKEVIILYFFHEYTLKEISQLLDISEAAAEKRLARARDLLRKKMEVSQ